MLIKLDDLKNRRNNLLVPHKGRVVFNNDPLKLGRIKVRIRGLLEETDLNKLPYIVPKNAFGLGGKPDSSNFSVPEVNSEVTVEFPFSDINLGFYTGYWQSNLTHQYSLFDDDYPNSYGFIDSQIQWVRVNKTQKESEFFNDQQDSLIKLENDGSLILNVKKDLNINVNGNFNLKVDGTVLIVSDDVIQIKSDGSKDIYIESSGDTLIKPSGKFKVDSSSDIDLKSGGNLNLDSAGYIQEAMGLASSISSQSFSALTTEITNLENLVSTLKTLASNIRSYTSSVEDSIGGF
jgi:hypothetical protein